MYVKSPPTTPSSHSCLLVVKYLFQSLPAFMERTVDRAIETKMKNANPYNPVKPIIPAAAPAMTAPEVRQ